MQPTLFGSPAATNGFRDSSFAKNKNLPLHRWVPWIAGFSADFVDDAIEKYLPERNGESWVLDPFAGVGTTLVESYLSGLNVIGFEINPYAALATKIKLNAMRISVHDLTARIATFERFMEKAETGRLKRDPRSQAPIGFSGRTQLFSPKVQRKVLYALDFISSIEDSTLRDIFRLGLGSVMVSFSNYSYEPSLTRRAAVGKTNIEEANVGLIVSAKLHLMLEDIGWAEAHMRTLGYRPKARVCRFPRSTENAESSPVGVRLVRLRYPGTTFSNRRAYKGALARRDTCSSRVLPIQRHFQLCAEPLPDYSLAHQRRTS